MGADGTSVAARHLVPLADSQWALWRWVGLRGSGFPSPHIARLAPPSCALVADELIGATARVDLCRQEAIKCAHTMLDRLRSAGQWEDATQRRPLLDAITQINKGKLPKRRYPMADELNAALDALADAGVQAERARQRADQTLGEAQTTLLASLRAMARDTRFCEAMLWQNHDAYRATMAPFLEHRASDGVASRSAIELAVKYLQRYYTKNDSIGFFGPIGWATLALDGPPISVRPGATLLATRTVSFEQWCVDALAARWSRLDGIRRWIAPRRLPTTWLAGTVLQLAEQSVTLPVAQVATLRAVLDLCDGTRPACELAAALLAARSTQLADEQAVYSLLESLEAGGLISWSFNLPLHPASFERLEQALRRIADRDVSTPALNAMEQLDSARRRVAEAAGDPVRLGAALGQLADHFTEITGQPASQAHGRTYGARTLVYEDCQRDLTATIGPSVWREISMPLGLLLNSARWLTFQVAQRYRALFMTIYQQLAAETQTAQLPLTVFWQRVEPYLFGTRAYLIEQVVDDFQRRWDSILRLPEGQRSIQYRSADLRPTVADLFAAPGPGWSMARYHSPDILIAAASPAAINAGAYTPVMGELHVGSNTLRAALFVRQHPAPDELLEAVALDVPEPCVVPIEPKHWPGATARTHNLFVTPKDVRLLVGGDAAWYLDDPQALPIGSLVLTQVAGELLVRSYDQRHVFDCIEFVSAPLTQLVVDRFKMLPAGPYTPRVSIDRLVIGRETWRFNGQAFAALFALPESQQFIEMRRWMGRHGFPRYVFVRVSSEQKPFFVDFANPLLVALLVKTVRQACSPDRHTIWVTVSEMLPSLDELWLTDADGQRYTSELRFVAVDQVGTDTSEDWGYL